MKKKTGNPPSTKNPLWGNETAVNPFPGTERTNGSLPRPSLPLALSPIYCRFCTLLKTLVANKNERSSFHKFGSDQDVKLNQWQ